MLIDFPSFEDYLEDHGKGSILDKGQVIFNDKAVKHIHAFSGTEWDIYVESENPKIPGYTVRLRINGNKVVYQSCNCMGFRYGPVCKHIVASLFAVRSEKLYDSDISEYAVEESEDEGKASPKKEKAKMEEEKGGRKGKKDEEDEGKGSRKKVVKNDKKEASKKPPTKSKFEDEMECVSCRSPADGPIMLPCQSHIVCSECAEEILDKSKNGSRASKDLACPSCGKKEGVITVKNAKELKINRELERIKIAYEQEKKKWAKEKEDLQKQLEELRKGSGKGGMEQERGHNSTHNVDIEKLNEVADQAFFSLKKDDAEKMEELVDKMKDDEEDEGKGRGKRGRKDEDKENVKNNAKGGKGGRGGKKNDESTAKGKKSPSEERVSNSRKGGKKVKS